jgi:hypothetical protein
MNELMMSLGSSSSSRTGEPLQTFFWIRAREEVHVPAGARAPRSPSVAAIPDFSAYSANLVHRCTPSCAEEYWKGRHRQNLSNRENSFLDIRRILRLHSQTVAIASGGASDMR